MMILGLSDFAHPAAVTGRVAEQAMMQGKGFEAALGLTKADTNDAGDEIAPDEDAEIEEIADEIALEAGDVTAMPYHNGRAESRLFSGAELGQAPVAFHADAPDSLVAGVDDVAPLTDKQIAADSAAVMQEMGASRDGTVALEGVAGADATIGFRVLSSAVRLNAAGAFEPARDSSDQDLSGTAAPIARVAAVGTAASDAWPELGPWQDIKRAESVQPTDSGALEAGFDPSLGEIPDAIRAEIMLHQSREAESASQPNASLRHHPAHAHDVARQITQRLIASDQNRIEITLTPEELGTIKLVITPGDTPSIAVYSDNRETLDLLRRNAELLQRELRDTGFGGASLSFGQENHGKAPSSYAQTRFDAPADSPPVTAQGMAARILSDRRLDIRI